MSAGSDCGPRDMTRMAKLFCNQRYGDWPMDLEKLRRDPWANPDWMLLSHGAKATASSTAEKKVITDAAAAALGKFRINEISYDPQNVSDENVQTWWKADPQKASESSQWISLDLGKICDVHAVQLNFADDDLRPELPEEFGLRDALMQERWIDRTPQKTRWLLEGSENGTDWMALCDKRQAETDLPHDLVASEDGWKLRYVRLTVTELPYGQTPCVSGLRVFGLGGGSLPAKPVGVNGGPSDAAGSGCELEGWSRYFGVGRGKVLGSGCGLCGQLGIRAG